MKKRNFCIISLVGLLMLSCCAAALEPASSPAPDSGPQSTGYAKIRFSIDEVPLETHVTYHYAHLGIYFGGDDPFTTNDGTNMANSPVLSGTPIFEGAIEGRFIIPQSPDPNICDPNLIAVASWFSLDVGGLDEIGTTRLEWFDPHDVRLGEVYNSKTGIETIRIEGLNIARWRIEMTGDDINGFEIDNIDFELTPHIELTKTDNVADGDCVRPHDAVDYTVCWHNKSDRTLYDAVIIDYLSDRVSYEREAWTVVIGDPNDPNQPLFTFLPPSPNYNPIDRTFMWEIGDISPNQSDCVSLPVFINDKAIPGGLAENIAELWATIYDANGLNPEFKLIARAIEETPVCCETDTVIYVDASAAAGGDGRSWQTAYRDVQDALTRARAALCGRVYEIWVAQGTYYPGPDESDTFDLRENIIALYGGFKPGGCPFEQRDPKRYVATLSGKIDATRRNDTVIVMGNNTYLDGFTVTEAGFDGQCVFGNGADFSLVNCVIEDSWQYGIRAIDGHVDLRWCTVRNNLYDGIRHSGAGYAVNIENCWFMKQGRVGILSDMSTPALKNSIITESDLSHTGNAGIRMVNPSNQPIFVNCTLSHNKNVAVSQAGGTMPSLINSIVYHNNSGGPQLSANLNPDVVAQYCCIADCNEVNNNINADPEFAYFDPNNVRIMASSLCRDSGLTILDHYNQFDMDKRDRVLGSAVDRGAYEIECEDTANPFDWNADGRVNYSEFSRFAAAFCGHDPNDPLWLANPELADPDLSQGWYEWKYKYNLDTTGDSEYSIDLADLMFFVEESPWLWCACWLPSGDFSTMYGEETLLMGGPMLMMRGFTEPETVSLPTVEEQIAQLVSAIVAIQNLRLEPEVQQEIDSAVWNDFVDTLYQELIDLHWETQ